MRLALSQANTRAAMITPMTTANARLCSTAVVPVTTTMTNTSDRGILLNVLRLAHSKVPIATMIINPVSAAIGNCSTRLAPTMMKITSATEATIPDRRARAPFDMLIRLCPSMAHPPIPEKNPERILATPCAKDSLLLRPRVLGDFIDDVQREQTFDETHPGHNSRIGENNGQCFKRNRNSRNMKRWKSALNRRDITDGFGINTEQKHNAKNDQNGDQGSRNRFGQSRQSPDDEHGQQNQTQQNVHRRTGEPLTGTVLELIEL